MKKEALKKSAGRYAAEDEHFWRQHRLEFLASGMARTSYCQQHGVNYDRFSYWLKKIAANRQAAERLENSSLKKTALLPVQIKPSTPISISSPLCTLTIKNGHVLTIHDERALLLLLERWQ